MLVTAIVTTNWDNRFFIYFYTFRINLPRIRNSLNLFRLSNNRIYTSTILIHIYNNWFLPFLMKCFRIWRFSLIQCRFSAYFMIHGFLEAGDKFYGLFAPMVFIILYQKRQLLCATTSISRVLAALFSSTNFFLVQKSSCCPLLCINVNWARIFVQTTWKLNHKHWTICCHIVQREQINSCLQYSPMFFKS